MRRSSDSACQKVITTLSSSGTVDDTTLHPAELHTVRRLGWSVVESNLRLGRYSPDVIDSVRALYCRTFSLASPGSLPLNLHRHIDPSSYDLLGRAYEQCLHATGARKTSGNYYSHPEIVRYMVNSLRLEQDRRLPGKKFIDIACGTGIFLSAAIKKSIEVLRSRGLSPGEILKSVPGQFYGIDINPVSCEITRINVYITLLNHLSPEAVVEAGVFPINIHEADSIENRANYSDSATLKIKHRKGLFRGGFDYVLGNPPYLEAKRMPRQLKEQCEANFPELEGAFDLYMAFICQCNRLVARNGKVHLILPDKFTVARYARPMRQRLLSSTTLLGIADLSGLGVFSRAKVYPVLLHYQNSPPAKEHALLTRVAVSLPLVPWTGETPAQVPQAFYAEVGSMSTIFPIPPGNGFVDALRHIFRKGIPLGEYLHFRSTITFHKKGLREQFVRKSISDSADTSRLYKYLGGPSYSRKNEVELLGFDWQGYYIDYDQWALKRLKNRLPALENFTREKLVFCQHARRIIAAYDEAGEYVCKDVYPVAFASAGLERSPFSLRYFAGLLNSELMSFIYNTLYKGIQISGGYYHYLPTWINVLPVITPPEEDVRGIEGIVVTASGEKSAGKKAALMTGVDEIIYRTYGITSAQRAVIKQTVPRWPGKSIT